SMSGLKRAAAQGTQATDPDSLYRLAEKAKAEAEFILHDRPIDLIMTGESAADKAAIMYQTGGRTGPKTGFERLDQLTGGLYPELWCFMGAPAMGKSTLACTIAGVLAQQGLNGLVFTTETKQEVWMSRVAISVTRVDPNLTKEGRLPPHD